MEDLLLRSIGTRLRRFIGPVILLVLLAMYAVAGQGESPVLASGAPAVAGRVIDSQGAPVRGAVVRLYLNGAEEPQAEEETGRDGEFIVDVPDEAVETARLEIDHPHFEGSVWEAGTADLEELNAGSAIRLPDITIQRTLTIGFWVAAITFVPAAARPSAPPAGGAPYRIALLASVRASVAGGKGSGRPRPDSLRHRGRAATDGPQGPQQAESDPYPTPPKER
jgi:hypothetical protein